MCKLMYHKLNEKLTYNSCLLFIKEYGIDVFYENIKRTSVLLNPYPEGHKHEHLVSELTSIMSSTEKHEQWKCMVNEAHIVNSLYEEIYNDETYKKAISIGDENAVSSFLICMEICLRSQWETTSKQSDNRAREVFKLAYEDNLSESEKDLHIYESILSTMPSVLAYLLFYKCKDTIHQTNVTMEDIRDSFAHVSSASKKAFIDMIEKEWQFDMRTLKRQSDKLIESVTNENIYNDYTIMLSRFEQRRREHMSYLAFYSQHDKILNRINKDSLDLETSISLSELSARWYLEDALFVDHLTVSGIVVDRGEKIAVDIRMLIRAYACLVLYAQEFLSLQQNIEIKNLTDVCMKVDTEHFKAKLASYQITGSESESIIEVLKFRKDKDLVDCPLIKVNDDYFISPTSVISMDISQAVLSRISEFKFRGVNFEDVVIQELRKVGIKAECYTHRVGKEEYQCDVLFSIDNKDVYICECKSWGMFLTPNGYYEHEVKIHDAKKQLDRIAEAFEKEKGLIEQILQVTCIRKVYRLIITNIPVGINNRCESTQIIDFYALKKFLSREKPSISLLSKSQQLKYTYKGFSMYDGNVTCLRMQKFLENPAPVDISRKLIKKVKPEIEIGKYSIEYEFSFEEHRSPDSIDETDQIRQLIED